MVKAAFYFYTQAIINGSHVSTFYDRVLTTPGILSTATKAIIITINWPVSLGLVFHILWGR